MHLGKPRESLTGEIHFFDESIYGWVTVFSLGVKRLEHWIIKKFVFRAIMMYNEEAGGKLVITINDLLMHVKSYI